MIPAGPSVTARNPLLDPSRRLLVAHRGASADAPENTLEAFALAVEQGADAFELDVHLSGDGVPVVIHDPTLARTTDRGGQVRVLPLAEIQAADAGAGFTGPGGERRWAGRGVRVPALTEVLRAFPALPVLIEIKVAEAQEAVATVLEREGATGRCVVASFRSRALRAFARAPFLRGASRRDILALYLRARLGLGAGAAACLCYAVPDYWKDRLEIPTDGVVSAARAAGRPVHVWTVDDPDRAATLWARGVSGIITNRPGRIRQAMAALTTDT